MEFSSPKVELLSITKESEKLIEKIGRLSHKSEDKITDNSYIEFIRMIKRLGHYSILEHASASFLITGVTRATTHQWVRHRIASYTEKSLRYVEQGDYTCSLPETIASNPTAKAFYESALDACSNAYRAMRILDIPKEDARGVLNHNGLTEITVTMNFRAWYEFFGKRLDKAAQWEIREITEMIHAHLLLEAPVVFE